MAQTMNGSSRKFSSVDRDGNVGPYPYRGTWARESLTSSERLVMGPQPGTHVAVSAALVRSLPEPFDILYVLVLSRIGEHLASRYQSPRTVSAGEVGDFLTRFATFLEQDGRHHLWLHSSTNGATLVYDRHDVIYAYGPIDQLEAALHGQGLVPGTVAIPAPHQHAYHPEFDETERAILSYWEWRRTPLQPMDEA